MRHGIMIAASLACCAGCSGSNERQNDAEWAAAILPDASDPAATIRLTAGPEGKGCATFWNGGPVTGEELAQRSRATMDDAVAAAGGLDGMTAARIPYLNVEVAPDLHFACVEPVLAAIQEVGYSRVGFKPDLIAASAHFVHFPLMQVGAAPPSVTVAIDPSGAAAWNGEKVDLAALTTRARQLAGVGSGGTLVIVPARQAEFSAVYKIIEVIREHGVEPDLALE
jgi:biopolymer transport protein ExbD